MGMGRMSSADWDDFTTKTTAGRPAAAIFTSRGMKESLDPKKIILREARDSVDNPNSTPIIIGVDVTGSMGMLAENIVRTGLKTVFQELYDRKPVSDPAIMFNSLGDFLYDSCPFSASQFESDISLASQLTDIYIESGGGGNSFETYSSSWYFAAMKVVTDSWEKRHKKGYLFTLGDENPNPGISAAEFSKIFGPGQYTDLTSEQMLDMASKYFHVFHIIISEGSHCRYEGNKDKVIANWRKLLGQNAIVLSDYTKLAETIVSTIQVTEGDSVADVAASWGGDTSVVISKAVGGLVAATKTGKDDNALVAF